MERSTIDAVMIIIAGVAIIYVLLRNLIEWSKNK